MRFYLYEGRHGEKILVKATREGWDYLIKEMENDNRCSIDESIEDGFDVSGSFAEGRLSVDDGGHIEEIGLTEVL